MSDTLCPVCGERHADALHLARCAYIDRLLGSLLAHAASLDHPPSPAQVRDLWACMRGYSPEGAIAARAVQAVLDLGWRPRPWETPDAHTETRELPGQLEIGGAA